MCSSDLAATAPATTGGFVANLIYCGYKFRQNGTLGEYVLPGTASHWLGGTVMGAFWYGGLAAYGFGIWLMGDFGTVVGWPLLMGMIIISSNLASYFTGEWTNAGTRARNFLLAGIVVILVALVVLAKAQQS